MQLRSSQPTVICLAAALGAMACDSETPTQPDGGQVGGSPSTGGISTSGGTATGGTSTSTGGLPAGGCDPGTTTTAWATHCPTAPPTTCVSGTWTPWGSTNAGDTLVYESPHFAVYSNGAVNATQAQAATDTLENVVWKAYFGSPMFLPEPYCNTATKRKASIIIHSDYGLSGGCDKGMGMWINPGATSDHWGLAHEFMHAVQCTVGTGLNCASGPNLCGWIYESHANYSPHQLPEYANNVHCSEYLFNMPHLYLGSTRDRYCNWQFMEYLKDRYCYQAVNDLWTASTRSNDPFNNLMSTRGWTISQLNDFFGEWAMHNVTWDYPVSGGAFRSTFGAITDKSRNERRLRLTQLEPLDASWASNRRFQSPYYWAPERWGYNVVRLYPDSGATTATVTFRGVTSATDADWRWSLVATNSSLTTSRYSAMQKGSDGQVTLCLNSGEYLFLVVMGTPSVQQHIVWDQAYTTIPRYPYLVQFADAWPEGFQGGTLAACPSGTVRVANGGGCGPSSLPSSVYVGPYALVTGGTISANVRIEDHAQVLGGTVTSGTVGAMTIFRNFTLSADAKTTFYPIDFFEGRSWTSGTLLGDVELRSGRTSGSCSGMVDGSNCGTVGTDATPAPPYTWR